MKKQKEKYSKLTLTFLVASLLVSALGYFYSPQANADMCDLSSIFEETDSFSDVDYGAKLSSSGSPIQEFNTISNIFTQQQTEYCNNLTFTSGEQVEFIVRAFPSNPIPNSIEFDFDTILSGQTRKFSDMFDLIGTGYFFSQRLTGNNYRTFDSLESITLQKNQDFTTPLAAFYFSFVAQVKETTSEETIIMPFYGCFDSTCDATSSILQVTILPPPAPPTITLSELPARESRVYNDFEVNSGEEYSFRFKVDVTGSTGIPRFSFLGADGTPEERHEAEWNQNTKYVEVKINSRGGGGAPDEEKTLVIQHAGATSKEVKFDLDNQAPSLVSPSDPDSNLYKIINLADPHIINDYVTSVSGSATDETSLRGGRAVFSMCRNVEGQWCYVDEKGNGSNGCSATSTKVTENWLDYTTQITNNGTFAINNLPSENGATYSWELALVDQAGNETTPCTNFGNYQIEILEEPYDFQSYSTNPRSPVLEPESGALDVKFALNVGLQGPCAQDIGGITGYWAQGDTTRGGSDPFQNYDTKVLPWFRNVPAEATCEEWRALMNPAEDCGEWPAAWGQQPSGDWCHEGWYKYLQENQAGLHLIDSISGAKTGLIFNQMKWSEVTAGTYYPLFLIKDVNGNVQYALRGDVFRMVSREGSSLVVSELQDVQMNSYLDANKNTYLGQYVEDPAADPTCENNKVTEIITAQKRVAPLMEGTVINPSFQDGSSTLEMQIFEEHELEDPNPVTHAYIQDIPIATDGTWSHAYRLGESANPFEVSDANNCHAYFMRFRAVTEAGEPSNWTYECAENGDCVGAWYAFKFTHQAVQDTGSTLADNLNEWTDLNTEEAAVADGVDGYEAKLYLTDKYGNIITHFDEVEAVMEPGKYDIYRDTGLEYSDKPEDSAVSFSNNNFANKEYFYSTNLFSISPTVFSDRKLKIQEGSDVYELSNLAYGLTIPRNLALGAKITSGGEEILHAAQKIDAEYLNKDSDCDGYSDGLELTYGTYDKVGEFPNFLDRDCVNPNCGTGGDDSCGIPTGEQKYLSYDDEGNLVFMPIYDEEGGVNLANAPAAFFRSPLDVKLYYLLENDDGVWEPTALQEETWRTQVEGDNTYEIKLPKIEIFTGGETRFRVVIKNMSDTISYDLNAVTELLQQIFSFVEQNAQFGEMQILDVMLVDNSDQINPDISRLAQGDYSFNTETTGEFTFNVDTELSPSGEGSDELWIDFSAWPGITNRSLLTTRVLAGGKIGYTSDGDKTSVALLSPELLYLYRADTYPGSTPSTEDEEEREMEIRKIKEEILANIMDATRPLPAQSMNTNFYQKLRNGAVCLGDLNGDEIDLMHEGNLIMTNCAGGELSADQQDLVASYDQGRVYAFRDMNIVIGDGEHPVNLPETELSLVTVGGNIILASDLLPGEDGKALGLVALRERVDSSQTAAYRNDPLTETTENEATPGGNLLVSGNVTNILAHVFMEGALLPIDFDAESETQNKYLSSVWDFLTEEPLQSTYHYDDREQNRMNQLYIHGLVFSSYNTYGGFKDSRPYSELIEDNSVYNLKLDLRNLRSYIVKDGFLCSPMLIEIRQELAESEDGEPCATETCTCADVDPRSFIINTATDYGLPKIFESKGEIKVGEV